MLSILRGALPGAMGLVLAFGLFACTDTGQSSSADGSSSSEDGISGASDDSTPSADSSGTSDLPQGNDPVELDPADFTTHIDNPYWPMVPGTRWTYREIDEEGKKLKVVVIVTHETKKIANGIT